MYWNIQEKLVFYLLFLIVFAFQISSFIVLRYEEFLIHLFLIAMNILFFFGMTWYAKWVWKDGKFSRALKRVIATEFLWIMIIGIYFILLKVIKK